MSKSPSKLDDIRKSGRHQVEQQRASILDAAERLFLQLGLEQTSMVDIAAQAGITKITLYRYFPNRDMIALEIQARMLNRISAQMEGDHEDHSVASLKKTAQAMIRSFIPLREAFRYIGMFDKLYMDYPFDTPLAQWTKRELASLTGLGRKLGQGPVDDPQENRRHVILNTVVWFLEKLALRGELTWSDQSVPLEEHLRIFEEMIVGYIDQWIEDT